MPRYAVHNKTRGNRLLVLKAGRGYQSGGVYSRTAGLPLHGGLRLKQTDERASAPNRVPNDGYDSDALHHGLVRAIEKMSDGS